MCCPLLIDDSFWPIVVVTLRGEPLPAETLSRELGRMRDRPGGGGPFALVLDVRHGALALDDDDQGLLDAAGLVGRAVVCGGDEAVPTHEEDDEPWASFATVDDAFGWCLARITADARERFGTGSKK